MSNKLKLVTFRSLVWLYCTLTTENDTLICKQIIPKITCKCVATSKKVNFIGVKPLIHQSELRPFQRKSSFRFVVWKILNVMA